MVWVRWPVTRRIRVRLRRSASGRCQRGRTAAHPGRLEDAFGETCSWHRAAPVRQRRAPDDSQAVRSPRSHLCGQSETSEQVTTMQPVCERRRPSASGKTPRDLSEGSPTARDAGNFSKHVRSPGARRGHCTREGNVPLLCCRGRHQKLPVGPEFCVAADGQLLARPIRRWRARERAAGEGKRRRSGTTQTAVAKPRPTQPRPTQQQAPRQPRPRTRRRPVSRQPRP